MSEPTYPCEKCGKPRTRAEGGTTFTVCDACWAETSEPIKPATEADIEAWRGRHTLIQGTTIIPALIARIDALKAELAEARAFAVEAGRKYNNLLVDQRILTCAFCGEAYPSGTPPTQHDALTVHIMKCEKHPLRGVIAERDRLKARMDAMMPLFEEARDALPAITETSARIRGVRLDLADRMDAVGDPERWAASRAAIAKAEGR